MSSSNILTRYSVITDKNPREIVLLRGNGCKWRRCTFCDYHLDFNTDDDKNFKFNGLILENITGEFHTLEVINSGSFSDLDEKTMSLIKKRCTELPIKKVYFECHWNDRHHIEELKKDFYALGLEVQIKGGVETFDNDFREKVFVKGIDTDSPEIMAEYYDQVCLLFGVTGQSEASMRYDLETALKHFNRVCVNIMTDNSTDFKPDSAVIKIFENNIYTLYKSNPKVDILWANTDFGVGKKMKGK